MTQDPPSAPSDQTAPGPQAPEGPPPSWEGVGEGAIAAAQTAPRRFGTFQGVFRPTILTILGALLYLREGWVVGHAGLGGFILILAAMYLITTTTALSMASITTNIRIGQGGVFSIICQSLGLEAGGAIGVPFYLAQSLGAAMYIFAFTEGWQMIFPEHPTAAVAGGVYLAVALLAFVGAGLAFRTQSVVMVGIIVAMGSVALGLREIPEPHVPAFWGSGKGPSMTELFAIFFPAATGVLVGASMSGSLASPRRSIPRGTLAAVGVSFAVYLLAGVWYATVATPAELQTKMDIMRQRAAWGPLVLVGLLSSTFSATLSSFVAAPRVLQALASFDILPRGQVLAHTASNGEPRRAMLVTTGIVGLGLLSGSLDAIAPMLTVFFLITYASINLVLLIEQSLGLPSFRPTFRVSRAVPTAGFIACFLGILATSPIFGLMSLGVVVALYGWLVSRRLEAPFETARSGLFVNIANWAAKKVSTLPSSTERSWKPDLLTPAATGTELAGSYRLLRALAAPKGSVRVVGLDTGDGKLMPKDLGAIASDLAAEGIYTTSTLLETPDYGSGAVSSLSVLLGDFFPPNIVFVSLPDKSSADVQQILDVARAHQVGTAIYVPHPRAGLGRERAINLWVRDQSPDWKLSLKMASLDLSLLLALSLRQNWGASLRMICVVDSEEKVASARAFLDELQEEARISGDTAMEVLHGDFQAIIDECPRADINIMGLGDRIDAEALTRMADRTRASCLFIRASGKESALA